MENTMYVVRKTTLKELQDICKTNTEYWGKEKLYECVIDRSDLSEEQKEIQKQNGWVSKLHSDVRIFDERLSKEVEKIGYEEILNGCKEKLADKIFDKMMGTEIKLTVCLSDVQKDGDMAISMLTEFGEDTEENYIVSEDMAELEKMLKKAKRKQYFRHTENEFVYVENVEISVYCNNFRNIDEKVKRLIKKFIKEKLTYCIKCDKIIVPQEYIDKGKSGIEEWREIKRTNNKSNNIENRIFKQTFKEKKQFATSSMYSVMNAITRANGWNYKIPFIAIDGRYNKQRTSRLVNKVLEDKSKKEFMTMEEEEILNRYKDYWKEVLNKAIIEIDNVKLEDIK